MVETGNEIPQIREHGVNSAWFNVRQRSDSYNDRGGQAYTKKLHQTPVHRFSVRKEDAPFGKEPVMSENSAGHSAR